MIRGGVESIKGDPAAAPSLLSTTSLLPFSSPACCCLPPPFHPTSVQHCEKGPCQLRPPSSQHLHSLAFPDSPPVQGGPANSWVTRDVAICGNWRRRAGVITIQVLCSTQYLCGAQARAARTNATHTLAYGHVTPA